MKCQIIDYDCEKFLGKTSEIFDLTFLDPPFNQNKEYGSHNDDMQPEQYWNWMKRVCKLTLEHTSEGGAIYFMQREKNTEFVLESLRSSGWTLQSLIIWKKKASAIPAERRFGKHYQIIAFATKGKEPRVFNKLRINPPLLVTEKHSRPTGMYVTDVWDDIRELTSGYFAGDEPIRLPTGDRAHKQQSPVQLLARIILSSTNVGDIVFDPFAGTGTTLVVAKQLYRNSLGIEIDPLNMEIIRIRLSKIRDVDELSKFREDYGFTAELNTIWPFDDEYQIRKDKLLRLMKRARRASIP